MIANCFVTSVNSVVITNKFVSTVHSQWTNAFLTKLFAETFYSKLHTESFGFVNKSLHLNGILKCTQQYAYVLKSVVSLKTQNLVRFNDIG